MLVVTPAGMRELMWLVRPAAARLAPQDLQADVQACMVVIILWHWNRAKA